LPRYREQHQHLERVFQDDAPEERALRTRKQLSGTADEVGRMLGGWLKHEIAPEGAPSVAAAVTPPPPARRAGGVRFTMTSPTIETYLRTKLAHPETVVFLTVGSFCQTFFEDAAFCGAALGLRVRNLAADSEPERIPSCGFPRRVVEKYVALLQQRGRAAHVEEGCGSIRRR